MFLRRNVLFEKIKTLKEFFWFGIKSQFKLKRMDYAASEESCKIKHLLHNDFMSANVTQFRIQLFLNIFMLGVPMSKLQKLGNYTCQWPTTETDKSV